MEHRIDEENEDALFERLRSIAECHPDHKMAFLVRSENEIKAAYRAAVYGEISILFGNIFTDEEAERARDQAGRAFRALLEENREFNGFIPKGILIDTPFTILSEIPTQGFDFVCYHIEKISLLLAGEKKTAQKHRSRIEKASREKFSSALPCQTVVLRLPGKSELWICKDEV